MTNILYKTMCALAITMFIMTWPIWLCVGIPNWYRKLIIDAVLN